MSVSIHLFVAHCPGLFSFCLFVSYFDVFVFAFVFVFYFINISKKPVCFLMRDRKAVNMDGVEGKELGGIEEEKPQPRYNKCKNLF